MRIPILGLVLAGVTGCSSLPSPDSVYKLESPIASGNRNYYHQVPNFDWQAKDIATETDKLIKNVDFALNKIGATPLDQVTFENTLEAIESATLPIDDFSGVVGFLSAISPRKDIREASLAAELKINQWAIQTQFRKDIFNVITALAKKKPTLNPVQQRLLNETLKGFKQNGLFLSDTKQLKAKELLKKISDIETKYQENIQKVKPLLIASDEQLKGVPESYFATWPKDKNGLREVNVKIASNLVPILKYAVNPDTRKEALRLNRTIGHEDNGPLLKDLVTLRAQAASTLGFKTWADYKLSAKMAETPKAVFDFLGKIDKGLTSRYKDFLNTLTDRKRKDLNQPKAQLELWDTAYYTRIISEEEFQIDDEKVKEYFELGRTLSGMMRIYEQVFGLKFIEVNPPFEWASDIRMFVAKDSESGIALGTFFLDLYPRDNKYSHFAVFPHLASHRLADGRFRRPAATFVGNYTRPTDDIPSLLSYDDVRTLFHEFGHILHVLLSQSEYLSLSGTRVPRDFVEGPSQMLENWVNDPKVLAEVAQHYKTKEPFPASLLEKIKKQEQFTLAAFNKRQLFYGLIDMNMHSQTANSAIRYQPLKESIKIKKKILYWDTLKDSNPVTRIGHFAGGYDAGYYGYLWSEAISDDLASIFANAPNGFFDKKVGMRLRREIYETGNTRPVEESVESFLGRPRSLKPFFDRVGIK